MVEYGVFNSVLILLAIAVVVSVICRQLQLPVVLGYLLIGTAVGPFALGWVPDITSIQKLANFGVVFLMFTVGLEFSWSQLLSLRRAVLLLGLSQVTLTVLITTLMGVFLHIPFVTSLIIGGIVAMSSTAIVVKLLSDQLEIAAQHGTNAIGILLFQDLAVIPFLILIPSLALLGSNAGTNITVDLAWSLSKGIFVIGLIISVGRWLLRPLFRLIASTRVIELFTLTVLLVTLGSAWLTHYFGLSLSLGAFLAGIMLGETEFHHQIEVEIRPFRDVLLGLFFISIGMLINVSTWSQTWPWIGLLLIALIIGKGLLITIIGWLSGYDKVTSLRTGLVLAQGSEFGFALLTLALLNNLISTDYGQVILSALLISIAIAPVFIHWNRNISRAIFPKTTSYDLIQIRQNLRYTIARLRKPVILCGYGRVGQNIARILEKVSIDYLALDIDPSIIQKAQTSGDAVKFGDATHPAILHATKLNQASAVVISFSNPRSILKVIDLVRHENKKIPIIVRCHEDSQFDELRQHGASDIIAETFEQSLILAFALLTRIEVPHARASQVLQKVRSEHYDLLRQVFPGSLTESAEEEVTRPTGQLKPLVITEGAYAINCTLKDLALEKTGARIIAVGQGNQPHIRPHPKICLQAGDILILFGTPEALTRAERLILNGT